MPELQEFWAVKTTDVHPRTPAAHPRRRFQDGPGSTETTLTLPEPPLPAPNVADCTWPRWDGGLNLLCTGQVKMGPEGQQLPRQLSELAGTFLGLIRTAGLSPPRDWDVVPRPPSLE
eukprot:6455783-Pyramimonas_sp.AAC.1